MGSDKGSSVPDFSKYMNKKGEGKNKLFHYFMVGTMGALSAAGAKSAVHGTLLGKDAGFVPGPLTAAEPETGRRIRCAI